MAISSYLDLGVSSPTLQNAATNVFAVQNAKRLAVTPAIDLSAAITQSLANRRAGQTLLLQQQRDTQANALAERKLALDTQKQAFDQGQLPWATAAGALGGAVQLYGGYQAWQDAAERKALSEKTMGILAETNRIAQQNAAEDIAWKQKATEMLQRVPDYTYVRRMQPSYTLTTPVAPGAPAGTPAPDAAARARALWEAERAKAYTTVPFTTP
jgi:hypothetical protein